MCPRIRPLPPALACVALLFAPTLSAAPPGVSSSEVFKRFESRWTGAMDSLGVPGLAIVIVQGDEVVLLDGLGVRDAGGQPVTPDTMFYIASSTKPFNAMAVLALAEAGKLDLDAPVKKYLPEFKVADARVTETLTIRDLLCHRPGINSSPIVFNDAYSGQITDALYFELLSDVQPSGEVEYSNVHFTLLGRVIRSASGKHWRDTLQERILEPAGMKRTTGYASVMYGDANVAQPMIQVGGKWVRSPLRKTDETMHAAGGMGTTARDLGRWLRINMNGGMIDGRAIVSTAGMEDMLRMHAEYDSPNGRIRIRRGFGLGWMRGNYREDANTYIEHGGGYIGTSAHVSFIPEKRIGVGIVANSAPGGRALSDIISIDIYDHVLGVQGQRDLLPMYNERYKQHLAKNNAVPTAPAPGEDGGLTLDAQRYVGRYVHDDWGTVHFSLQDGRLVADCGVLHMDLHTEGPDRFAAVVVPGMVSKGHFELQGQRVSAVTLETLDGANTRFERRD